MASAIIRHNNNVFIGYFGQGVRFLQGKQWQSLTMENGLVSNYVRSLLATDDELWLITAKGVSSWNGTQMESFSSSDGLPHNYCYTGQVTKEGVLYIGTEAGVAYYENGSFFPVKMDDSLMRKRIKQILELEDGTLLLMSDDQVISYNKGEVSLLLKDLLMPKEVLNAIACDHYGNLWLGSEMYGLVYFNSENNELHYLSQEHGFPFSRVRTLSIFGEDNLLIGTESGAYKCRIDEKGDILSIYTIGKESGYPDFEVNLRAGYVDKEKILLGTNIGLVSLDPGQVMPRPAGPPVYVTDLKISFKDIDWTSRRMKLDQWFQVPVKPVLEHSQNDLLFEFKGISLKTTVELWYKYKINQQDNQWSEPTRTASAIYPNLRPGKYTFMVKSSFDGIQWEEEASHYEFLIVPPFWKTWWFYVILSAFILAGFVFFNNYRIKTKIDQLIAIERIKKEEYDRIQKKVAMDFHDEVGNHLASISLLIQLIKNRQWEVPDELEDFLDKIDQESKHLFSGTKDFVWSLDPSNDNLRAVFHNIRDYGTEIFENSSISFNVMTGTSDIEKLKLPPGFTRQIVLIFKEALNNAFRHAECRNVYFSIDIKNGVINIRLQDDGKGFNTKEKSYYEGIKKMKYRGTKIKSDLLFSSGENEGTEIVLKAELNG